MVDWQPIETAPRDGRLVLLGWPPRMGSNGLVIPAKWFDASMIYSEENRTGWYGHAEGIGFTHLSYMTHWMPFPNPPEAGSGRVGWPEDVVRLAPEECENVLDEVPSLLKG